MRTQAELRSLLEVYEGVYRERLDNGGVVDELPGIIDRIKAQIVEGVTVERPGDSESGDPEPSQLEG